MPRPVHGRAKIPAVLCTLALGAALTGGCRPGGEYGYDRVSHRQVPPEIPEATNPEPPAARPGLLASSQPQKLTLTNAPAGVTQAMVDEGQQLFASPCAGCHGVGGVGTPAGPPLNDGEWLNVTGAYPELVTVINNGVAQPKQYPGPMPAKGGGSFDDNQVRALAAYVYALSHQSDQ